MKCPRRGAVTTLMLSLPRRPVICFWVQWFVLEVRRGDGKSYSPDSLYQPCCRLQRALRNADRDVNLFDDFQFAPFSSWYGYHLAVWCSSRQGNHYAMYLLYKRTSVNLKELSSNMLNQTSAKNVQGRWFRDCPTRIERRRFWWNVWIRISSCSLVRYTQREVHGDLRWKQKARQTMSRHEKVLLSSENCFFEKTEAQARSTNLQALNRPGVIGETGHTPRQEPPQFSSTCEGGDLSQVWASRKEAAPPPKRMCLCSGYIILGLWIVITNPLLWNVPTN